MYSFWLCSMATITAVSQYSPAILKQWAAATQPCPFPPSHSSTYPILAFFLIQQQKNRFVTPISTFIWTQIQIILLPKQKKSMMSFVSTIYSFFAIYLYNFYEYMYIHSLYSLHWKVGIDGFFSITCLYLKTEYQQRIWVVSFQKTVKCYFVHLKI